MDYTKLDYGKQETRFLRVLRASGQDASKLCFEVVVASLSSPPAYVALSYCWGADYYHYEIFVDGKAVEIRQILDYALYYVNLRAGTLVWIDALCIDQQNLHEKNYQVGMMGVIYAKASQTFAWLGRHSSASKDAYRFLDKYVAQTEQQKRWSSTPSQRSLFKAVLWKEPLPAQPISGLLELLSRPHWERIWIIQEIAKCPLVYVLCSGSCIKLDDLLHVVPFFRGLSMRCQGLLRAIERFRRRQHSRPGVMQRITLYEALVDTRFSLATDPHDKVFALLGLTSDGSSLVPTPSYAEPISYLHQKLTAAMLHSSTCTNILLLKPYVNPGLTHQPAIPVDWSNLIFLPAWLTASSDYVDTSRPWACDKGFKVLRTRARFCCEIEDVAGRDLPPSRSTSRALLTEGKASRVMETICASLLKHFALGYHQAAKLERETLTDALARMIRDAEKGAHTDACDFDVICHVLRQLGDVLVQDDTV